jgi:hypothetical protein
MLRRRPIRLRNDLSVPRTRHGTNARRRRLRESEWNFDNPAASSQPSSHPSMQRRHGPFLPSASALTSAMWLVSAAAKVKGVYMQSCRKGLCHPMQRPPRGLRQGPLGSSIRQRCATDPSHYRNGRGLQRVLRDLRTGTRAFPRHLGRGGNAPNAAGIVQEDGVTVGLTRHPRIAYRPARGGVELPHLASGHRRSMPAPHQPPAGLRWRRAAARAHGSGSRRPPVSGIGQGRQPATG